jgi:opacity protein-like surface antigen
MKRASAFIAAALLLAAPAIASAQYEEQPDTTKDSGWGFGIKGGVSWNNVSNHGLLPGDLNQFTGWTLGVGFGTTGTPVSIGIEALWARRGLESNSSPDARRFDYVDVPAFLKIALPAGAVAPYVFAGPQVSFEITCQTGDSSDCPGGSSASDRPMTTYAAVVGAGLRLGESARFSVEGRYMYGLSDLRLNTVTNEDSYRQRSFLILGGIGF